MPDDKKKGGGAAKSDESGGTNSCTYGEDVYKHGEKRCDEKANRFVRCNNGNWEMTDEPCTPGQRG